ncbi:hypothetical protein ACLOJK_027616 [Asimina triloba]
MFRRKPSKIEVKVEDKQELEEARRLRSSSSSTTAAALSSKPSSTAAALLHHLDRDRPTKDPSAIAQLQRQRIGLPD